MLSTFGSAASTWPAAPSKATTASARARRRRIERRAGMACSSLAEVGDPNPNFGVGRSAQILVRCVVRIFLPMLDGTSFPGGPLLAIGVMHRRRLRYVYRSAGWPCQDAVEIELIAAGLLVRERGP